MRSAQPPAASQPSTSYATWAPRSSAFRGPRHRSTGARMTASTTTTTIAPTGSTTSTSGSSGLPVTASLVTMSSIDGDALLGTQSRGPKLVPRDGKDAWFFTELGQKGWVRCCSSCCCMM